MRGLLFTLLTLILAMPSYADEFERVAPLACDGNNFIVRFGLLYNRGKLESAELQPVLPSIDFRWKTLTPTSHCILEDGRKVDISVIEGQAYPYGKGGADPDANFTLRINGTTVYYKRIFYRGYGSEKYDLSNVSYDNGILTECNGAQQTQCTTQAERLEGKGWSENEQKAMQEDEKRATISKDNPALCDELIAQPSISPIPLDSNRYPIDLDSNGAPDEISSWVIDLDGKGVSDTVLSIGSHTHYFDGNYFIVFYDDEGDSDAFLNHLSKKDIAPNVDTSEGRKKLEQWGGHFISVSPAGSSPNYVSQTLIRYMDHYYIDANEGNAKQIPARSISEILPDHSIKTICQFN